MGNQTGLHDGIVGVLVLAGVALGFYVHLYWLLLPAAVGALLVQSAFTGFCPVYYTLKKLHLGEGKDHTGTPLHH